MLREDPERLLGIEVDRRYQINRFLGQGNFGFVYAAEELIGEDAVGTCALKLLWPGGAEERAAALAEIRSMAGLEHPRLVAYRGAGAISAGFLSGAIYVAMQLAEASLETLLEKGRRLSVADTIPVLRDLGEALAYLHENGAAHRDVKPANVLRIGRYWKLGDFGLLCAGDGGPGQVEAALEGTPLYLAPECMQQRSGPPVDAWALGVLAQRCLTGDFPYRGASNHELLAKIVMDEPYVSAELPPPFDALVRGCLTKDPARRWTVAQVLEALDGRVPVVAPAPTPPAAPAPAARPRLIETPGGRQRMIEAPVPSRRPPTLLHVLKDHSAPVKTVAFSPEGGVLASGCAEGLVNLWDAASGESLGRAPRQPGEVTCLAFAPRDTTLALGAGRTVQLWDASGSDPDRLLDHEHVTTSVAFAPDGTFLATGSRDGAVCLWSVDSGAQLIRLRPHTSPVLGVAVSSDGRFVAAASADATVSLIDVALQQQVGELRGHERAVQCVAWSPTGLLLVSGSADGTARLWQGDRPSRPAVRKYLGHEGGVNCVTFPPLGGQVATACDDAVIRVFDVGSERAFTRLAGHRERVLWVAYSPSGGLLASAGAGGNVIVWSCE